METFVSVVAGVVLFAWLSILLRQYFIGVCQSKRRLDGATVLITGGTSGIGKETVRELARRGARVIVGARNLSKARKVIAEIISNTGNTNISSMYLDLTSLKSVKEFSEMIKNEVEQLDVLINNAGVFDPPELVTEDGFETMFQANYLGHFLLTILLLEFMKKSAPSRIINVSSSAGIFMPFVDLTNVRKPTQRKFGITKFYVYAQTKFAQIAFTKKLAEMLKGSGVTVYSLHPGMVNTDIIRHAEFNLSAPVFYAFGKTSEQGAQTTIHCAVQEGIEHLSGEFFDECAHFPTRDSIYGGTKADVIWDKSLEMVETFLK